MTGTLCILASIAAMATSPDLGPQFVTETAEPATIRGTVRLYSEPGKPVRDPREFSNAVVYYEPENQLELSPPDEPQDIWTQGRKFEPRVLAVIAGTEVRFPNGDPILHNVFSTSPGNRFDLGIYGRSAGKSHRFNSPGLVRVFCNVHSDMSAHIVVVNSPYFTTPNRNGDFELDGLPPGPGRLTLWHERSEPHQIKLELAAGDFRTEEADLVLTVRPVAPTRERFRRRGRY